MIEYITKDGDILDEIAFRFYGPNVDVGSIFEVNLGLSQYPPRLPPNLKIFLPDITTQKKVENLKIWE